MEKITNELGRNYSTLNTKVGLLSGVSQATGIDMGQNKTLTIDHNGNGIFFVFGVDFQTPTALVIYDSNSATQFNKLCGESALTVSHTGTYQFKIVVANTWSQLVVISKDQFTYTTSA